MPQLDLDKNVFSSASLQGLANKTSWGSAPGGFVSIEEIRDHSKFIAVDGTGVKVVSKHRHASMMQLRNGWKRLKLSGRRWRVWVQRWIGPPCLISLKKWETISTTHRALPAATTFSCCCFKKILKGYPFALQMLLIQRSI